jgi:hypothetical protein
MLQSPSVLGSNHSCPQMKSDDNSPILRRHTYYCSILRWGRSCQLPLALFQGWAETVFTMETNDLSWVVDFPSGRLQTADRKSSCSRVAGSFFLPCPVGCDPSDSNFQLVGPRVQMEWNLNIWSWKIFGSSRVEMATLPSKLQPCVSLV